MKFIKNLIKEIRKSSFGWQDDTIFIDDENIKENDYTKLIEEAEYLNLKLKNIIIDQESNDLHFDINTVLLIRLNNLKEEFDLFETISSKNENYKLSEKFQDWQNNIDEAFYTYEKDDLTENNITSFSLKSNRINEINQACKDVGDIIFASNKEEMKFKNNRNYTKCKEIQNITGILSKIKNEVKVLLKKSYKIVLKKQMN